MSVIINGTGGGFTVLTAPLTLYVRTPPVAVTLSNGSPCIANWPSHGLQVNDPVSFSKPYDRNTCTITIANPGVVTYANHGYNLNDPVAFDTSGALPTGLSINTTYWVIAPTVNTFEVAATPSGAPIVTTGTQSGTHYAFRTATIPTPVFEGAIYFVKTVIDANNFTFCQPAGTAAINSSSTQVGKIVGQTGNDQNNGLTQTRTGALMTVGKAWRIICGTLNLNTQVVTVQCAPGTYYGGAFTDNVSGDIDFSPVFCSDSLTAPVAVFWLGGGQVILLGNASNPDAVVWRSNSGAIDANCDFDGALIFRGLRLESDASPGFSTDFFQSLGYNTITLDTINFGNIFNTLNGSSPRLEVRQGTCQLINPCQVMANGATSGIFILADGNGTFFKNDNISGVITGVNNPQLFCIFEAVQNGFINTQLTVWAGLWNYQTVALLDNQGFILNHNGFFGSANPQPAPAGGAIIQDRGFYLEFQSPTAQSAAQYGVPGCPVDLFYLHFVPTTGFSQTLNNSDGHVIIDPAGALAAGTIVMTPNPSDGQMVDVRTSQAITAMTFSPSAGQSVVGAPTTLGAGQGVQAIWDKATTTWYFTTGGGSSTPGGTTGQIQYNNAGAFGGFGYWDGSANTSLGNSTTAQTLRVYNTVDTISGPTNYERGIFDWNVTANFLTVGTQNGGTGSARNLNLAPAGGEVKVVGNSNSNDSFKVDGSNVGNTGYANFWVVGNAQIYQIGLGNSAETNYSVANKFFVYDRTAALMRFVLDGPNNKLTLPGGMLLGWSAGNGIPGGGGGNTGAGTAQDTAFARAAAALAEVNNGTAAGVAQLRLNAVAVGSLPAPSATYAGARATVNNANATLTAGIGTVVAGGGGNTVPVFCDGTNWRIG